MADIIATLPKDKKISLAIERSLPMLPADAASTVKTMLEPANLAMMCGTLILWAGSHFCGIGEIVDIILLATGFVILGFSIFSGAAQLSEFTTAAITAKTDTQLNQAAEHFAKAVTILGVSILSTILLRGSAKSVIARGVPRLRGGLPEIGQSPAGVAPSVSRVERLPRGILGKTDVWGNITITRQQTISEQRLTLYHEWVHRVLSPKFGPFRRLRAQISASGYERSALLRYIEEALAESFSQLKGYGFKNIIVGIRFPVKEGYMTISQLTAEGTGIGNIFVGGTMYRVFLHHGPWKKVAK